MYSLFQKTTDETLHAQINDNSSSFTNTVSTSTIVSSKSSLLLPVLPSSYESSSPSPPPPPLSPTNPIKIEKPFLSSSSVSSSISIASATPDISSPFLHQGKNHAKKKKF